MVSWRSMEGRRDDSEDQFLLERHLSHYIQCEQLINSSFWFLLSLLTVALSSEKSPVLLLNS